MPDTQFDEQVDMALLMDDPNFTLGISHRALLGDLQALFLHVNGAEQTAIPPDADGAAIEHEFRGGDPELVALVAAIKRLGLRATLVAHPPQDAMSLQKVMIEL